MLKKIFQIKLVFLPPIKSKILIYDNHSYLNGNAKILFKNKKIEIYHSRYEQLNIYILLKSIFFPKYLSLSKNYKFHYLKKVSPKLVYTSIDNNPSFYILKDIYPNAKYIADQESMRDNSFYDACLCKKKKLKCDYFFVLGEYEKKRIKKIIDAKIIIAGHTKNNEIDIYRNKKKRLITYISSKIRLRPKLEIQNISNLLLFCKKFKYDLIFLDRNNANNKKFLTKIFSTKNLKYQTIKNYSKKIKLLHDSTLVAFAHSTLGYQTLSRNIKTISFNHHKYNFSNKYNPKKIGLFWCKAHDYKVVEKKMLRIIKIKNSTWKKISTKYAKRFLIYDKYNTIKKSIINKALK